MAHDAGAGLRGLVIYIFCGKQLPCAKLRPANIDGSAGAVAELQRIIGQIRARFAHTRIILRADSGLCAQGADELVRSARH